MEIQSLQTIYFSPTRTTAAVLDRMAAAMGTGMIQTLDLTRPGNAPETQVRVPGNDLALFGVPVYSGRVPRVAVERLEKIRGDQTPAVVMVTYGNREFEDALIELTDLVKAGGFVPLAGAAFIGEHSYSTREKPIAMSRPDPADLDMAAAFAGQVRQKLQSLEAPDEAAIPFIPGNRPYKPVKVLDVDVPVVASACTLCGTCAEACPVRAIDARDPRDTDGTLCIHCCACVKACPEGAREFRDSRLEAVKDWLYTHCSVPRSPEFFL